MLIPCFTSISLLIFVFIYISCVSNVLCFNVKFYENYNAEIEAFNSQIFKRELYQFFDRASYAFNGFEKIDSIPVPFPLDICILQLDSIKYAACLHKNSKQERTFSIYKMNNGTYNVLMDMSATNAINMDCINLGSIGYIALAYNITMSVQNAYDGSPIFQIFGDEVRAVQYFPVTNLVTVHLSITGNDMFLLQTFANTVNDKHVDCPYFKWSGSSFYKIGQIPCSNARHIEPFSINYESYVAVANYADRKGRTSTNSEIYKYIADRKKFQLIQKIPTSGAVDVKFFSVPFDEEYKLYFLVFGNSINKKTTQNPENNLEADTIFYQFDKGQFVPYQSLAFYAVEQFLPIQSIEAGKFLLLVACKNQDIKIYNLNDWKFEESSAQFTAGSLGKGVAKMRVFRENDNSYLIIANENMMSNVTNVFLPIFKQEEEANMLRQQIIDWSKVNMQRLATNDVQKLKTAVEDKLKKHSENLQPIKVTEIPEATIENVITKSLVYPKLNLDGNYWKSLSYTNQALDALESVFSSKRKIRKREIDTENEGISYDDADPHQFDDIAVDTLIVRTKVRAQEVNGINTHELHEFDEINAEKIIVTEQYEGVDVKKTQRISANEMKLTETMEVVDLYVTGKLNNYSWDNLVNDTVKRLSDLQFIKSPLSLSNFEADSIIVNNNKINNLDIGKLIPINGDNNFVINQDIQFAAPIAAKNIIIKNRLNNIHVFQNKLDVLLKHSNETQIIEGLKKFDNLKVLEPITTAGELLGKHFRDMSPNKAIHDPLTLNGDYFITGDVTIVKELESDDILLEQISSFSIKNAIKNGIHLNDSWENLNFHFEQAMHANNSIVSFINGHDVQRLVPLNLDNIIVIEGNKTFTGNLEIHEGFSEVKYLNGIDVENVHKELFQRHTNETIQVPMHFGTIIAKEVQAKQLILAGKNLSDFLTKTGNQKIQGTLKTNTLQADNLTADNLNINGILFNYSLAHIYQQKAKNIPQNNIFQYNDKYHGTIYVKNLQSNGSINDRLVSVLENELNELEGNIKFFGNFKFKSDTNFTNFIFEGSINGVPSVEFGQCWLQTTNNIQVFTAPQTYATVISENGILLDKTLNALQLDDFIHNAFWINRNEAFNHAKFRDPVQMRGVLFTNMVNGLQIPNDILYRISTKTQILQSETFIGGNVKINTEHVGLNKTTLLNGFNLNDFFTFLYGYANDGTLHVEHANLYKPPSYFSTLNGHNLKEILDNIWMANENVHLHNGIEIFEGYFQGLIELEGHVNNMNLQYLKDNYFSLSSPQEITNENIFINYTTIFDGEFNVNQIHLYGQIVVEKNTGESHFDFHDFVSNTLKNSGHHDIMGKWEINKGHVEFDFVGTINGLNLATDVLNTSFIQISTLGEKYVHSSQIFKLYATPESLVNGIPVAKWIRNSVYAYENYTIRGISTLDRVNLYNDLQLQGYVNGIPFNEETLLLRDKDQTLNKNNVYIHSIYPQSQKVLTNNFENLYVTYVNHREFHEILDAQVQLNPIIEIGSHLIFTQPLIINESEDKDINFGKSISKQRYLSGDLEDEHWSELKRFMNLFTEDNKVSQFKLDHFELRQRLSINATKLVAFVTNMHGENTDYISLIDGNKNSTFYKWHKKEKQFVKDNDLTLTQKRHFNSLIQSGFEDIIGERRFYNLSEIHRINEQKCRLSKIDIKKEYCFSSYNCLKSSGKGVGIYCLQVENDKQEYNLYEKYKMKNAEVKQILGIGSEKIALLFNDKVEIWNTTPFKIEQEILQSNSKAITYGYYKDVHYLAIISKTNIQQHIIGIYSLHENETKFEYLQTLGVLDFKQVTFSYIKSSDDLLLFALTATNHKPLIVFQYKGVQGFYEIMRISSLPSGADTMKAIQVENDEISLIALNGINISTTFVEVVPNWL